MLVLTPNNRLNVSRLNPFTDLYSVMDRFMNDAFPSTQATYGGSFPLDIKDQETSYLVVAELPGVTKESVELVAKDNKLTISVNQATESESKEDGYLHRERRNTSLSRSIFIKNVDLDGITAKLENGLLEVILPKLQPEATQKNIPIN